MRIINSNSRLNEFEAGVQAPQEEKSGMPLDQDGTGENAFAEGIEVTKLDAEEIRKEVVQAAQEEADRLLADARAQAQQLLQEADEQKTQIFEEQKALGYSEGAKQKEEELEQKIAKAEEDLEARRREQEESYEQRLQCMEGDIVDAVIQVFDKVFQIQFSDKREILLALVANTLLDVNPGNKIKIRVNEADHAMLEEHLQELQEQVGRDVDIEFMRDKKYLDGQCQIETAYGVFDCGIDTQLSGLIKDIRSLVMG